MEGSYINVNINIKNVRRKNHHFVYYCNFDISLYDWFNK